MHYLNICRLIRETHRMSDFFVLHIIIYLSLRSEVLSKPESVYSYEINLQSTCAGEMFMLLLDAIRLTVTTQIRCYARLS